MRTHKVILYAALALLAACSKKNDNNGSTPPESTVDTVNYMSIASFKINAGYDTTDNYMADLDLRRRYGHIVIRNGFEKETLLYHYVATTSPASKLYTLKYVGKGVDLIKASDLVTRFGTIDVFYINKALLGKAIFEAYDLATGKLVKTYVASPDSVAVEFGYSIWDNLNIIPKQNADALDYCLNVKQADWIHYW
ncbi:hypothetical protein Q4E93_10020 [Flavitalea sp. BT771]|uniref:hypothetical protein n=1 Tax=Flavitalea sp. BT771 TaxID=3063329 RepID=UPI0026E22677|nr:hypothetical protein [Flavitalea sp. BT771]MDO6430924.1 hypothetical protein [Flavitalea sp. BT771]MDV6218936.1 hypothetical protein [Flavitalea sp. BT771]